jgi:hypothetical protein
MLKIPPKLQKMLNLLLQTLIFVMICIFTGHQALIRAGFTGFFETLITDMNETL